MQKYFIVLVSLLVSSLFTQDVIDISVKGISDNNKHGSQQDRLEAIMDAKRQACEKAGLSLKSHTQVKNFQIEFDYIETQSEAILLPGFQIIDIGYVADGTYQVVLSGKIKNKDDENNNCKFLVLHGLHISNYDEYGKYDYLNSLYSNIVKNYNNSWLYVELKINNREISSFEKYVKIYKSKFTFKKLGSQVFAIVFEYQLPRYKIHYKSTVKSELSASNNKVKDDEFKFLSPNKAIIFKVGYRGGLRYCESNDDISRYVGGNFPNDFVEVLD